MAERPTMTTTSGFPVADNQNSITAGPRGPVLMQDFLLFEKLAHQNRERIPERGQHAKGSGAYGTLTITKDVTKYTKAKALSQVGKKTEAFLRFSTVAGERGAADAERDVRGFALRFYTEEGNWDLVGNNTPVFFVRDALKFPDFIHTQKRHPKTKHALPHGDVGFLVAVAGEPTPGDHLDVGPRAAAELSQHRWLRLPHLFLHQRQERAALGQVPLQDHAGHQELDQCRSRTEGRT